MNHFKKNRRTLKDRRQKPTKPFSKYMLSGRRQTVRRQADRKVHLHVDRYGLRLLIALLLIVTFSMLDAYFTIFQVERGAREINPFMNFLIGRGYTHFFWVKYALTGVAVLFLCVYKNHSFARAGILSILVFYLGILCYHLFWLFMG